MLFDLLFWGFIVLCFPLGVALRWARDDYNSYCIERGYKKGKPKITDSIDVLERELFPELEEWQRWNNIGKDPELCKPKPAYNHTSVQGRTDWIEMAPGRPMPVLERNLTCSYNSYYSDPILHGIHRSGLERQRKLEAISAALERYQAGLPYKSLRSELRQED